MSGASGLPNAIEIHKYTLREQELTGQYVTQVFEMLKDDLQRTEQSCVQMF